MTFDARAFLDGLFGETPATVAALKLADAPEPVATPDDLSEHWRGAFEERAGIMEFDANMTRQDAERFALADILKLMRAAGENPDGPAESLHFTG
ncbi:MAG: hypothetical protein ABII12_15170 [Planctomycetota bacterium]